MNEGIATNILADRLQRLEQAEIIQSKDDPEDKKRTIYKLTPKGIDLIPVLLEIILWSAKNDCKTAAPKQFIARLKNDRQGVIDGIRKRLET